MSGCLAIPCNSTFPMKNRLINFHVRTTHPDDWTGFMPCTYILFYFLKRARACKMGNERGMKPVRLLGWLCMPCGHEKYGVIALTRNRQAPGCIRIHVRWVSPPVRPLPLQWLALLRVILFARTCLQRSRLPIPPKAVCAGSHLKRSYNSTAMTGLRLTRVS